MPFSGLTRLIGKAFRFTFKRPIQRYNIYNRMLKRLGPDSKYFLPAPRHEEVNTSLYLNFVKHKQLEAGDQHRKQLSAKSNDLGVDKLIIQSKLSVNKIVTIEEPKNTSKLAIDDGIQEVGEATKKPHRPLPKKPNLNMDPAIIWKVDKTPRGRLNLDMLQEIMLNKISDENYWTPEAVADHYNIREDYAKSLLDHYKQIRIVVSPRVAKNLDYVGRTNQAFQATKHLVYIVDKSLRDETDKQFDAMFSPDEELDPEVRDLLDFKEEDDLMLNPIGPYKIAPPEEHLVNNAVPTRLGPINVMPEHSDRAARLSEKRKIKGIGKPSRPANKLRPLELRDIDEDRHDDELMSQSQSNKSK